MAKISIRTEVIDVVAVPDVCVLTFKDVNVDHRIDCSNFPEEIPRLQETELKPMQQESLSNRYLAEISVEWFPAWVLLCDPRWARSIKSCGAVVGPQRAFDLVRELMMSDDEQLARISHHTKF